jgi:hypothetical protein
MCSSFAWCLLNWPIIVGIHLVCLRTSILVVGVLAASHPRWLGRNFLITGRRDGLGIEDIKLPRLCRSLTLLQNPILGYAADKLKS